jgi:carbon storage regulator
MLVLTRKLMEKLFIGDDICVTVVRLEGGQVRLGIDAPREVAVVRAELVPDRPVPRLRTVPKPYLNTNANTNTNTNTNRTDVKSSPFEARGTDIRRRGRSR